MYVRILRLGDELRASGRRLSEYVRAWWSQCLPFRERTSLSAEEFGDLLEASARVSPRPLDPVWQTIDFVAGDPTGFDRWEATLLSQVADLQDFEKRPPGEQAYFGGDAPRPRGSGRRVTGRRWYNLDPATYLECAMAGTFGGHDLDDEVRIAVPGPVDPHVSEDPPTAAIGPLTWALLVEFAICGQVYE
jgi:hypothetical protein